MRGSIVATAVAISMVIGILVGYLLASNRSTSTEDATLRRDASSEQPATDTRRPSTAVSPDAARPRARPSSAGADAKLDGVEREHVGAEDDDEQSGRVEPEIPLEPEFEVERLRREVAALQAEHLELMGHPIATPTDSDPRFSGSTVSSAVGGAMTAERVAGSVEGTDCSEYPCIVFGRLEGDEEDMEEIERSAALGPYRDDVLTLLFWATSVDASQARIAKAPETGLFALAFYSVEDRVTGGDALDRRIRARVMEYWNTDRPALPSPP
jgi:hypothetical protein